MKRSYNEIMEEIKVTDEMRSRILQNCTREMEAAVAKRKKKTSPNWIAAAACLAVLLAGGGVLLRQNPSVREESVMMGAPKIEECASAAELEQKAGFPVKEPTDIPFAVTVVSYSWCWDEMAQIRFEGPENTLLYRKARGTEDVSGDYNIYSEVQTAAIGGREVTLKGENGQIFLALWQENGCSCALSVTAGLGQEAMVQLLQSLLTD